MSDRARLFAVTFSSFALLVACGSSDTSSTSSGTGATGHGGQGGASHGGAGHGGGGGSPTCPASCANDTVCTNGVCAPWTGFSQTCAVPPEPFYVAPRVACHWPPVGQEMTEGPAAFRWARGVSSTVVGARFLPPSGGEFPTPPPTWLVFATGSVLSGPGEASAPSSPWHAGGVLRVLDPASCKLVDTLDEEQVASWFQPPAIGDLDGDGVPEIIAQVWDEKVPGGANYQSSGHLSAWKYDTTLGRFRIWQRSTVNGAPEADLAFTSGFVQMSGPTIADLDDDGVPEVVLAGRVYDNQLRRLTGQAPPTTALMLSKPTGPYLIQLDVIADLDGDGAAELVYGDGIFTWSAASKSWTTASFFAPPAPLGIGHAAVADLGVLPDSPGASTPEIVVVGYDGVRVQNLAGKVLRQFTLLGSAEGGGAASIANVDDDPEPEIIVGTDSGVFVYDLQCDTDTPGPECGRDAGPNAGLPPLPRGVRWADRPPTPAFDFMGGTTFDFDGDGKLEVLYADECFLRVYSGATGQVVLSRWRPSRTASEVPIVLGAKGGADTVIAIGMHTSKYCAQATGVGGVPPYDPEFPGLPCKDDRDCFGPAGSCQAGLCRCTATADCCSPSEDCGALGYGCHPADDGTGNACRAVRIPDTSGYSATGALEEGLDVLSDQLGRWAASRPIWNQDAYAITGVDDHGGIPRTSDVQPSWSTSGINLFRSNVAGDVSALAAPDLTAREVVFTCAGGAIASMSATVCNRGARSALDGQTVRFRDDQGATLCEVTTATTLAPGQCLDVTCTGTTSAGTQVTAVVNPDGRTRECNPGSNASATVKAACP